MVDMEAASEYSWDQLTDSDQFHYRIAAEVGRELGSALRLNLEVIYQQLYGYDYRVRSGSSTYYGGSSWSTIGLNLLGQYSLGSWFYVLGGVGLQYFIDSDPAFALASGFGVRIPLGTHVIPIVLRVDPIFGMGTPIPISLNAGFEL